MALPCVTGPADRADRARRSGPTDPAGPTGPADPPGRTRLASADEAVAHTLLNCLLREVAGPERRTSVVDGRLLLRLPCTGVRLRVALRRTSVLGAHRFAGPVAEYADGRWSVIGWRRLAERTHAELSARTGLPNDEFLDQVVSSHQGVAAGLGAARPAADGDPLARYLASEQSLVYGHRFHPTPKDRSADPASWAAYAPEAGARFPLRLLAVRDRLTVEEGAEPGATGPLDRLAAVPDGYRLLPAHPWQYELLGRHPALRAALGRGDVLDLGPGPALFAATASVRTVYDGESFLKFSLNVRITNCLRKNAHYELSGAVALTRLLAPAFADLAARFPGSGMLREPAFRSLAVPGPDGAADLSLLEGFGVIVREGLRERLRPGATALLAAAVADEYPTGPGHISRLLGGAERAAALRWWRAYLRLLVPPVLAAYFDHGIVLEPHLQNVLVCVDAHGDPVQVLFRDLEGTKLLPEHHDGALAALPARVAGPLTYDADRGWDRLVYCLLVNHVAEMLSALADLHPSAERALWSEVRRVIEDFAAGHGAAPRLAALLAGEPLPAKANLLTRWGRAADREAGYVRLPSPLAGDLTRGAVGRPDAAGTAR
ncbi:IucA/IucC family protein [Streptomyces polygonati]|uniref:IucA/IucC family protein n=1 Tax=Streptomyces polygonati TaxID=1617087 RepID=A0ABV8HL22_9ACTN